MIGTVKSGRWTNTSTSAEQFGHTWGIWRSRRATFISPHALEQWIMYTLAGPGAWG